MEPQSSLPCSQAPATCPCCAGTRNRKLGSLRPTVLSVEEAAAGWKWNTNRNWILSLRFNLSLLCVLKIKLRMRQTERILFVISDFHREVAENCALLGHYAASSGDSLLTFRDNLSISSSGFKNKKILKMRTIGCPETSVGNYHYSLRNDPEERSSQNIFQPTSTVLWLKFHIAGYGRRNCTIWTNSIALFLFCFDVRTVQLAQSVCYPDQQMQNVYINNIFYFVSNPTCFIGSASFSAYKHTKNTNIELSRVHIQPQKNFHISLTFYTFYHTTTVT